MLIDVNRVISCPHCQLKLAIRSDLEGRRLACPKCKGIFLPDAEPAPQPESPAAEGPAEPQHLDFLGGIGGNAATGPTRGAASRATTTKLLRTQSSKSRSSSRLWWYIIGGSGGLAAILVIGAMMLDTGNSRTQASSSQTKKDPQVKYGLSIDYRHRVFCELLQAVDANGLTKSCKQKWQEITDYYKIDLPTAVKIVDEGFEEEWEQPRILDSTAQTRANRREYIKARTELRRKRPAADPILDF